MPAAIDTAHHKGLNLHGEFLVDLLPANHRACELPELARAEEPSGISI